MAIKFTFRNGRTLLVSQRQAAFLAQLGKGTYSTTDMAEHRQVKVEKSSKPIPDENDQGLEETSDRAFPHEGSTDDRTAEEVSDQIKADNHDLLETMDLPSLRELAREKGVKFRSNHTAERIRKALRGAE